MLGEFNCSSEDELITLQDKLDVYIALVEITKLIGTIPSPLQMLENFDASEVHQQDWASYWNSHVLRNCSAPLTDGVAAAHAEVSRGHLLAGTDLCCVHSLFDPHPANC